MSDRTRRGEPQAGGQRRLSGQDAVFVYGETPSMPMHTLGTLILDPSGIPGGFGFERIKQTVA